MKNYLYTLAVSLLLFSCADKKAAEKKLMDDIMNTHERVMTADSKLIDNKMLIDSLLKADHFDVKDSAAKKSEMRLHSAQLAKADEAMDNWMHNFEPHKKGISDDEQLKYLQDQNKVVNHIDTLITSVVKTSTAFLNQIKKK